MTPKKKSSKAKQPRRGPTKPAGHRTSEAAAAPSLPPALDTEEAFASFLVSVFAAFYWFDWLLLLTNAWPASSAAYYKIYAATLFGVLPLSLLTGYLVGKIRHVQLWDNQNLLPALLLSQTSYWTWIWCHPSDSLMSPALMASVRWAQPLVVVAAFAAAIASGRARRHAWTMLQSVCLAALPLLALIFLWHFKGNRIVESGTMGLFVWAALLAFTLLIFGRLGKQRPLGWTDLVLGVLLALGTISVAPEFDIYHQNCYLGPVSAVLGGRSMLVNVLCEYGVGVIYFLAAAFRILGLKPLYMPFTVLQMLCSAVEYLVLFWIARKVFRSRMLALLSVAAVICFNRYGSFWQWDNITFPSVGPLRFGLPIFVLVAGYQRRAGKGALWTWIEAGLIGAASIWSLETFIYSLSAWGFAQLAEAWMLSSSARSYVANFVGAAMRLALGIVAAYAFLTVLTLLRSGSLLHWDGYLTWMTLYSGTNSYPLVFWSPWVLLPGVGCLSLLASALTLYKQRSLDAGQALMAGLAGTAAAEFTYFIVRCHPNNLGHIATLFIVLLFYWIDRAWARTDWSGIARWTATPAAFFIVAALTWNAWDAISLRFSQSLLVWLYQDAQAMVHGQPHLPLPAAYAQVWSPVPCGGPWVAGSLRLIDRYAPDQKQIALFTRDSVEIYGFSGRISPFPIAFVDEERWITAHYDAMATGPLPLKAGDVMLVAQDAQGGFSGPPVLPDTAVDLVHLLDVVRKQFKLLPLEFDPNGVWAVRLAPLDLPAPAKT